MKRLTSIAIALVSVGILACVNTTTTQTSTAAEAQSSTDVNPFFARSPLQLEYPPFDKIKDAHFAPAFDRGMADQLAEIKAIVNSRVAPTFENTILALEKSGAILGRTKSVFSNLVAADINDTRKKIQTEYSPRLAAHQDAIYLNDRLYARVAQLNGRRRSMGLDAESVRLIERYHVKFVRAGARLKGAEKARLKAINEELAKLGTQFGQNVLSEVNDSAVVVDDVRQLDGLSESQIAAAAEAARARKLEGKYVMPLRNTSGQPSSTHLKNRALRERIYKASMARGCRGNEYDNTAIVARVVKLRAERAKLLGYPNHAAYVLADRTAQTPKAVNERLAQLAPTAIANARREAADIQAMIQKVGGSFEAQPWDWSYYAEKVRQERYAFDESQLKPYLELNSVIQNGVFFAAEKLYGITFRERNDLPVYHPDVRVFDVFDASGKPLAIFVGDFYARESKRGGAWMNVYVPQSRLLDRKPVVGNHQNMPKPSTDQPTLLTWDEVLTMFHEFGHALHGMLSDVKYPFFSGTKVPRDFVEFPSQVNEMWASWPAVLENYARHYKTGEPMPTALLQKVLAAQKFNQGFATTEYLAASLLDQRWHQLAPDEVPAASDVMAFESTALKQDGVDYALVPPRYRTPYFRHIMGGYSAGYYSYIWAEVFDADTVEWFKENGGLKRRNGDRFRSMVLSRGGSIDAMQMFREFRGRDPVIQPLLERRGLSDPKGSGSSK